MNENGEAKFPPWSELLTAYIRSLVIGWRTQTPIITHEKIGRKLGCTKENVVNISKGKTGIGRQIEDHVVRTMFGGSADALRKAAEEWYVGSGAAQDVPQEKPGVWRGMRLTFPAMKAALQLAEAGGYEDDFIIECARSREGTASMTAVDWWHAIEGRYPMWRKRFAATARVTESLAPKAVQAPQSRTAKTGRDR